LIHKDILVMLVEIGGMYRVPCSCFRRPGCWFANSRCPDVFAAQQVCLKFHQRINQVLGAGMQSLMWKFLFYQSLGWLAQLQNATGTMVAEDLHPA